MTVTTPGTAAFSPRMQGKSPVRAAAFVSLLAATTAALSWVPWWTRDFALGSIYVLVVTSFAASGVFLLHDRSTGRTGWAMIVAAACYEASWWWIWPDSWNIGPAPLLSFLFGYWWFAIGGLALLRYPEPVLGRRYERWYFIGFAIWIVGVKLFIVAVSRPGWAGWDENSWWLTVAPDDHLFRLWSVIFKIGTIVLALVLVLLLVLKIRRSRGLERADTLPASAAGIAIGILGSIYITAQLIHLPETITGALRTVTALAALVAPVAFLVSLTQRRLARSSVADLVVRMAGCESLKDVQVALREVLGDPGLVLALPAGTATQFVTYEGHPLRPEEQTRWRVAVPGGDGRPLAVLLVDPLMRRRSDLVHSAAVAGGLVLENGLLRDDLAAQLAQVQASRRRIAEAGMAERRRIERNLHDGAQQLLLSVLSSLSLAKHRAQRGGDPIAAIDTAGNELDAALDELRSLARGIHPAVLNEFGLEAAISGMADRLGIAAVLDITPTRLPEAVEETLYFVICEAMTNVVRHAQAKTTHVEVRLDDDLVVARISDDGRGGARLDAGTGLAGLRDRVESLRGDLSVTSETGHGTTLTVRVPCV
ncbi:sensor histidine kinase [Actinoplanes sp. HUAS TT8]|uniref:sensor histidine kinase n=1 Tax=Actinoplanes sp. HUAS TT8 TaxID=3447453 RepID=UPI003F5272C3